MTALLRPLYCPLWTEFTWTWVSNYEPYSDYDHIQCMTFTCTQKNVNIHVPEYMINVSIPESDYSLLFAQALVMFIYLLFLFLAKTTAVL